MTGNFGLEKCHQGLVHKFILVGDIEANDPFIPQVRLELGGQLAPMDALHDKDQVGPGQQLGAEGGIRILADTGRGRFHAWPLGKYLLGRRAAQAVLAAEKEQVQQMVVLCVRIRMLRRACADTSRRSAVMDG